MKIGNCLSLAIMVALFCVTTTQDLRATGAAAADQGKSGTNIPFHAISAAELHQSIQNSRNDAMESQKRIQDFLTRPEIKAEFQRLGSSPEKVKSQLALLSDAELLDLNRQLMSLDLQNETPAARSAFSTIIGLLLFALSVYLLVNRLS
jgi:hypothetical protein